MEYRLGRLLDPLNPNLQIDVCIDLAEYLLSDAISIGGCNT
jgi:hypothetical protein